MSRPDEILKQRYKPYKPEHGWFAMFWCYFLNVVGVALLSGLVVALWKAVLY